MEVIAVEEALTRLDGGDTESERFGRDGGGTAPAESDRAVGKGGGRSEKPDGAGR